MKKLGSSALSFYLRHLIQNGIVLLAENLLKIFVLLVALEASGLIVVLFYNLLVRFVTSVVGP